MASEAQGSKNNSYDRERLGKILYNISGSHQLITKVVSQLFCASTLT